MGKICSKCKLDKSATEFYTRAEAADGLRSECRECFNARVRSRLQKPEKAEKKRLADRAYYEREADRIKREARERYADPAMGKIIRARNTASRNRNPEKNKAKCRMRRVLKGDIVRAARRRHYQENKAVYKAASVARMKHIKQATPPWVDLKDIEALYVQAEVVTALTGVPHHVDHFYPLRSKTMCGLHVPWNLRIIPDAVNVRKGNAVPEVAASPLCCAWPQVYAV